MSNLTRRILALSFTTLFVLIAIPLLAMSAGFRFDWRHARFFRTGLFVADIAPVPDRILVDGKSVKGRGDPIRVGSLAPGSHAVRMEKDGFFPWEATVQITPGSATQLNALLFVRDTAPTTLATGVDALCASANDLTTAVVQGKTVSLLTASVLKALATLPEPVTSCSIADNGAFILARSATTATRIATNDGSTRALTLPEATAAFSWDTERPERAYALFNDRRLFALDFALGTLAPLTNDVLGVHAQGGTLYYVRTTAKGDELVTRDAQGGETSFALPVTSASWVIFPPSSGALPLLSSEHELFVTSLSDGTIKTAKDGVATVAWSPDGKTLAAAGALELKLVRPDTDEASLLLRSSTPYTAVSWFDDNHLLALHGDAVEWLELQESELLSIVQLTQRTVTKHFLLDMKMYFLLHDYRLVTLLVI